MNQQAPRSLPNYDDALQRVLAAVPCIGSEQVALADACGRVLRADVSADRDQPPFDRSAMDGYALRSGELRPKARFPVTVEVPAGAAPAAFQTPLASGAAAHIATGAPLPREADVVVPVEQSVTDGAGGAAHVRFLLDGIKPWRNVHRRGSDASAGQVVMHQGTRIGPQHVGVAAAVGAATLTVSQQPRVVLLTTGDEVVDPTIPTESLEPQQIRNSNGPMLGALLDALGVPLYRHQHVPDEFEETLTAAREALAEAHVVVTVGGVSVGERDWLPRSWQRLGLQTVVHGVAIQPGKPVFVACDGGADTGEATRDEAVTPSKVVIGLPGNPVSVLATAHLFLWPILRKLTAQNPALPWRRATLAEQVKPNPKRELFRAARYDDDGRVRVIRWHGSGDLVHTADAHALVRVPQQDAPIDAGSTVPVLDLAGC